MKNFITKLSVVTLSLSFVFLSASVAHAQGWVQPNLPPLTDNTPVPVNVGTFGQIKQGWLQIGGSNPTGNNEGVYADRVGGQRVTARAFCLLASEQHILDWTHGDLLKYFYSNGPDIPVLNPTNQPSIDVADCITAWPTGGGSSLPTTGNDGDVLTWDSTTSTWVPLPALPAGTTTQTMHHNGTDWVANNELLSDGNKVRVGAGVPFGGFFNNVKFGVDGITFLNGGSWLNGGTTFTGGPLTINDLYNQNNNGTNVPGTVLTNVAGDGVATWQPVFPTATGPVPNGSGNTAGDTLWWNGTTWIADQHLRNDGTKVAVGQLSPSTQSVPGKFQINDEGDRTANDWTEHPFTMYGTNHMLFSGVDTDPNFNNDISNGPLSNKGSVYLQSAVPGKSASALLLNPQGGSVRVGSVDSFQNGGVPYGVSWLDSINFGVAGSSWFTGGMALATRSTNDRVSIGGPGNGSGYPAWEKFQIGDRWAFHDGGTKMIGYNTKYDGADKYIVNGTASAIRQGADGSVEIKNALSGFGGAAIDWANGIGTANDVPFKINAPTIPQAPFNQATNAFTTVEIPHLRAYDQMIYRPSGVNQVVPEGKVLKSIGTGNNSGAIVWGDASPPGGIDGQVLIWNDTSGTWEWADGFALPVPTITTSTGQVLNWNTTNQSWSADGLAIQPGNANDTLRWGTDPVDNLQKWMKSDLMNNDETTVSVARPGLSTVIFGGPPPTEIFSAKGTGFTLGEAEQGLRVYETGTTETNGLFVNGSANIQGTVKVGSDSTNRLTNLFGKLKVKVNSGVIAEFIGAGDFKIKPGANTGEVSIGAGTTTGIPLVVNGNVYAQSLPQQYQTPTGWNYTFDQNFTCGNTPSHQVQFNSDLNIFLANASGVVSVGDVQAACASINGVNGQTITSGTVIKSSNTNQSCAATNPGYVLKECDASTYIAPSSTAPQYLYEVYASSWNNGTGGFPVPLPANGTDWDTNFQISVKRYKLQEGQVTGTQGNFIGNGAILSSLNSAAPVGVDQYGNWSDVCADGNGRLTKCPEESSFVAPDVKMVKHKFKNAEKNELYSVSCPVNYKAISAGCDTEKGELKICQIHGNESESESDADDGTGPSLTEMINSFYQTGLIPFYGPVANTNTLLNYVVNGTGYSTTNGDAIYLPQESEMVPITTAGKYEGAIAKYGNATAKGDLHITVTCMRYQE